MTNHDQSYIEYKAFHWKYTYVQRIIYRGHDYYRRKWITSWYHSVLRLSQILKIRDTNPCCKKGNGICSILSLKQSPVKSDASYDRQSITWPLENDLLNISVSKQNWDSVVRKFQNDLEFLQHIRKGIKRKSQQWGNEYQRIPYFSDTWITQKMIWTSDLFLDSIDDDRFTLWIWIPYLYVLIVPLWLHT